MNEGKRTHTKYSNFQKFRKVLMNQNPVVDSFPAGRPEEPMELVEYTVKPKKIKQKTPIQIGAEILSRGI